MDHMKKTWYIVTLSSPLLLSSPLPCFLNTFFEKFLDLHFLFSVKLSSFNYSQRKSKYDIGEFYNWELMAFWYLLQTFLGDFSKEQEKFVTEKKEKSKQAEAAVPPWVGYNEEESMKAQILALSKVKLSLSLSLSLIYLYHNSHFDKSHFMSFELIRLQRYKNMIIWRHFHSPCLSLSGCCFDNSSDIE